jgi:hypothetical protein
MSARELYNSTIRKLSPIERLRLATMILDELTASQGEGLDISDEWSDEDIRDMTAFSMKHAEASGDADA